jgi:Flavin containing amine oxidoreductase
MANPSARVDVTIVGGGIAGLTAALRLAQSGCKVTVYEEAGTAGGNLGGDKPDGIYHDVYPHMFGDWYNNFWKLVDDLGLSRGQDFKPMHKCAFLQLGDFPNFKYVTDNGSLTSLVSNLTSGIMPVPDMFLAGYSTIDLLSQDFSLNLLGAQTVNGFLASRPYATAGMADIAELVTSNIWGVNSYLTSAFAFQQFVKYQIRHPVPQCWVLKDNAYNSFIEPLINKLKRFDCDVNVNKTVEHVTISQGKVDSIVIRDVINNEHQTVTPVGNLILAIPPKRLAELVQAKAKGANESEDSKHEPIVSVLPQLSQLRRIRSMPIVVLDVAFRRRLPDIPPCYVSLSRSSCELTFVENPLLSFQGKTVLSVAASNPYALRYNFELFPKSEFGYSFALVESSEEKEQREWAYLLLKELHDYIPFNLGDRWGDETSDVDWEKTAGGLRTNKQHLLFINEVGSEQWRPKVSYLEKISNLFFAGDFCENSITIATVEAAVVSGLQAANALGRKENVGNLIEIIEPDYYPQSLMAVLKMVLAPYALGAKYWSASSGSFDTMNWGAGSGEAMSLVSRAASLSADGATAAVIAAMKWWEAMGSLYGWRRR